ncbi:DEAD/DEAH box helicase [Burkholderia sp. MS455]|uniref:DEAD/DEAH box helicase n=1 Tax=Burkholderia sp. MS455 TaxID=2811788 RepID=UPI00195D2269|nr:DEAD/DEAH box helicase [Burkholderia sp. MS455]
MLRIIYRESDLSAVVSWGPDDDMQPWPAMIRRIAADHTPNSRQEDARSFSVPWWNFAALRIELGAIFQAYGLRPGDGLEIGSSAQALLRQSKRSLDSYATASAAESVSREQLEARLAKVGFARNLTENQARNVGKLVALSAAATFSVPGAGKTTEALAFFAYKARESERLLVLGPKNAFAAWDEQIQKCLPQFGSDPFVRLRGGRDKIEKLLSADPKLMLLSYQQLARVPDLIAAHIARHKTFVYLDESHRIKSGTTKQTARAVLGLSHLPAGKLIMSGTPMPQAFDDLVPQFAFLYPEIEVTPVNVIDKIKPVYVRTNKKELGLPDVTRRAIVLQMAPLQRELYKLMRSEVAREARSALTIRNKQALRALGRSVSRLLQFVSNPSLLAADLSFVKPELYQAVLAEGDGPKLRYVIKRTRELTAEGHKVLIWSSFVRNVEYLAEKLIDLGAVYIHGKVDAGEDDDDETREGKIKLFHLDSNTQVMIANPAAASEGVSLHKVCHHAIYLDRTFNAAHYLQSEDRIHRLGLEPDENTFVEIVQCEDTVDETVQSRLNVKIERMAKALEDSSLMIDPIAIDPTDIEDYDYYSVGLGEGDIEALLGDLERF